MFLLVALMLAWTGIQPARAASTPSVVSLTRQNTFTFAGVGTGFQAIYSDTAGYGALTKVQLCAGHLTYPSTSLYAAYVPATNLLYLYNASNVAVGGFTPGSKNVITTALGSLYCAYTTVTGTGNDLTINWAISASSNFTGVQNVYLQAADATATSSWAALGKWTVTLPVPSASGLAPYPGTTNAGTSTTLSATYADTGGDSLLTKVQICVGTLGYPSTSLYAAYLPATNLLYLYNASNVAIGGFAPGSNNVIITALGSLNCAGTTVTNSLSTITVNWDITPTASLSGQQNVYLQASDAGTTSSWGEFGTWTIVKQATFSLSPATLTTDTNTPGTLTASYPDGTGASALTKVQICAGALTYPSTSLYAEYLPATNLLYLFNATNLAVGGFAPGSNNVITTTLGSLNCAATTVTKSGGNLTVAWDITPTNALSGVQTVYLQADDATSTGPWGSYGIWTIGGLEGYGISPYDPSSSTNSPTTLAASYNDGAGASVLTEVQIAIGSSSGQPGTFQAEYVPATNLLYLLNANNVLTGGFAPGSNHVITTPAGSLNCASTTVYASGDLLAVTWNITPTDALAGVQNLYLQASDTGNTGGWGNAGTWTIVPANDNFANAQPLSGTSGSVNGTTVGATVEPGEQVVGLTGTVWYRYTAPSTGYGWVTFGEGPVQSGPVVAYTGTRLANLKAIAAGGSNASFSTAPGEAYYLQVDSNGGPTPFPLNWKWYPAPANDDFVNAQAISGASGSVPGTTLGASTQTGEPSPGGKMTESVWYGYTAPSSAPGTVTVTGSNYILLAVYSGTSLNNLVQVPGSVGLADSVTFTTTPGTVYWVQAGGGDPSFPTSFTLNWSWTAESTTSAKAETLSGISGAATGSSARAD